MERIRPVDRPRSSGSHSGPSRRQRILVAGGVVGGIYVLIAGYLFLAQPSAVIYRSKTPPVASQQPRLLHADGLHVTSVSGMSTYIDTDLGIVVTVPATWAATERDGARRAITFKASGTGGDASVPSVQVEVVQTAEYADDYVAEVASELEAKGAAISDARPAHYRSAIWELDYTRSDPKGTIDGHVLLGDLGTGVSVLRVEWPAAEGNGLAGFLDTLIDIEDTIRATS